MDEPIGEVSKFKKFKNSKAAYPVAILLAIAAEFVLMYFGIYTALCGLGFVLVGAVGFLIVKRLSTADLRKMIIACVGIFLVLFLVGSLVISPIFVNNCTSVSNFSGEGITVNSVSPGDSTITISFTYTAPSDAKVKCDTIKVICSPVNALCYNNMQAKNDDMYTAKVAVNGSGSYSATINNFDKSKLNICQFGMLGKNDKGEEITVAFTGTSLYKDGASYGTAVVAALPYTALYVGVVSVIFGIIAFFSDRASKTLEKTRSQMEADGRLYPKGYGRCKQCGTIVLPGETVCRKCGAYIDVPEDMKVAKKDFFQCSECGAEVPSDAKHCPKCGATFDEDDEIVVVENNGAQKKEEKKEEKKE